MITLIDGANRNSYTQTLDAMYRGRAAMFGDRLGWDVIVRDGREIDVYDDENPLYLVHRGANPGEVYGSLRLMPTTGRTLLTDVFADKFNEPVNVRSPLIWEGTRFCVHDENGPRTATGMHRTTVELFLAMCEVGLRAGLSQIIAIYDPRLVRIYKRIGWSPEPLGHSDHFPHGRIYVGLWDISEQALMAMREKAGIEGSIIMDATDTAPALAVA